VVGDAFTAEIVVGALDAPWNFLRTALMRVVLKRSSLVSFQSGGRASGQAKTDDQKRECR